MESQEIDLHVHTSYSDGHHTPSEVVRMAAAAGLAGLAITDHDTVKGIAEAEVAAAEVGIDLIPGVEVSIPQPEQEFHLLGYWIDAGDSRLVELLKSITGARRERLWEILNRLHGLGVPLSYEEVANEAGRAAAIGRPHVARCLRDGGWVGSIQEAFSRYLRVGAPAYVPKRSVDPSRVLDVLSGAGGVSVLAHPGLIDLGGILPALVDGGLNGLEVGHPSHTADQSSALKRIADRHGLVATSGSDFHGGGLTEAVIGSGRTERRVVEMLAARRGR